MGGRRYTEEERAFLAAYIPGHSYREVQAAFSRRFGPIGLGQVRSYTRNHKISTGRDGRFKKGHVPTNKGKKMPSGVYEKAAPTMFKEGSLPPNTDPVGTEKVLSDGYVWVKVDSQPKAKKQTNWKQKHLLVWEEENGPVPEGHAVIFLNGDKSDTSIGNLALVTRAQLMVMNRLGLRTGDRELTRTGIAIASLASAAAGAGRKQKEKSREGRKNDGRKEADERNKGRNK